MSEAEDQNEMELPNRLRDSLNNLHELLARYGIVDVHAIDDPDGYDEGITLRRIERLKSFILTPNADGA